MSDSTRTVRRHRSAVINLRTGTLVHFLTRGGASVVTAMCVTAGAAPAHAGDIRIPDGSVVSLGSAALDTGLGDLRISGELNAGSATLAVADFTIESGGTVNGQSALVRVCGNWSNGGSFNAGTGTVSFIDGCRDSVEIAGSTTFNNLEISSLTGTQYLFASGETQTVLGSLQLQGVVGERLVLRSSAAGSVARLTAQGAVTALEIDINGDVDTTGGHPLLTLVADADGDGIVDALEGTGDFDGDGLQDYLDADAIVRQPYALYNLDNGFADEFGAAIALVSNGGTSGPTGYTFGANEGLTLGPAGTASLRGIEPREYAVEMSFRLSSVAFAKLLDFAGLATNDGYYAGDPVANEGNLNFFDGAGDGPIFGAEPVLEDGVMAHLVMVRENSTNTSAAYINGVEHIAFTTASGQAAVFAADVGNFFIDDLASVGTQGGGGFVNFIRLYDGPLTAAQIAGLANDQDGDGIYDSVDNCIAHVNPDQLNSDGVGGGDACQTPGTTIPGNADVDASASLGSNVSFNSGVVVEENAIVGDDVILNRNVSVGEASVIGSGTSVNQKVTIGLRSVIGSDVVINQSVSIGDGVTIGDGTVIGAGVVICDNARVGSSVTLDSDVLVEIGAIVADGSHLRRNAVVVGPGGSCLE